MSYYRIECRSLVLSGDISPGRFRAGNGHAESEPSIQKVLLMLHSNNLVPNTPVFRRRHTFLTQLATDEPTGGGLGARSAVSKASAILCSEGW